MVTWGPHKGVNSWNREIWCMITTSYLLTRLIARGLRHHRHVSKFTRISPSLGHHSLVGILLRPVRL
jgi:hypothetical protein